MNAKTIFMILGAAFLTLFGFYFYYTLQNNEKKVSDLSLLNYTCECIRTCPAYYCSCYNNNTNETRYYECGAFYPYKCREVRKYYESSNNYTLPNKLLLFMEILVFIMLFTGAYFILNSPPPSPI